MPLSLRPGVRVVPVVPAAAARDCTERVITSRRRRLGAFTAVRLPAEGVGHRVDGEDLTIRNRSQKMH